MTNHNFKPTQPSRRRVTSDMSHQVQDALAVAMLMATATLLGAVFYFAMGGR